MYNSVMNAQHTAFKSIVSFVDIPEYINERNCPRKTPRQKSVAGTVRSTKARSDGSLLDLCACTDIIFAIDANIEKTTKDGRNVM